MAEAKPLNAEKIAAQMDITISAVLHATSRYETFKALDSKGRDVFLKIAKKKAHYSSLKQEAWWYETVGSLATELPLGEPAVYKQVDGALATQYLPGEPLVNVSGRGAIPSEELIPCFEIMIDYILALDQVELKEIAHPRHDDNNSAPFNNLCHRIDEWSKKPLLKELITLQEVEAVRELITRHQHLIHRCLQHGDFVPWHILRGDSAELVLVDGEKGSTQKPRFYDLAYLYARVVSYTKSIETGSELLRMFISKSKLSLDEFWPLFLPVVTMRSLAVCNDSLNDVAHIDYRDIAKELLARCLLENSRALFGDSRG